MISRIQELKVQYGCIDCGYREHPAALDFDHVRGSKRGSVSVLATGCSWNTILDEIKKCVVRCAVCHRIKTHKNPQERGYSPRVKMSPWVAARRAELRAICDSAKSDPCSKCGRSFTGVAMDFDHIDPLLKKRNISRMIHSEISLEKFRGELAKCRLLCANCHRVETHR